MQKQLDMEIQGQIPGKMLVLIILKLDFFALFTMCLHSVVRCKKSSIYRCRLIVGYPLFFFVFSLTFSFFFFRYLNNPELAFLSSVKFLPKVTFYVSSLVNIHDKGNN